MRLLGIALGLGLLAGIGFDVVTFLVARYGPQGTDGAAWSFRGNGALVVPFGLGPAFLAGAWTALVLRARGSAHWTFWGTWAGTFGGVAVLVGIGVLIALGSVAQSVSDWLSLIPIAWMLIAPVLGAIAPLAHRRDPADPRMHVAAGFLLGVGLAAGFLSAELVVAPGS